MSKTLHASAAIALAVLLQCAATPTLAALATDRHAPIWDAQDHEVPAAFLDRAVVNQSHPRLATQARESFWQTQLVERRAFALADDDDNRAFSLAERVKTGDLPRRGSDDLDLCLWNLLKIVRSHKDGRPFDELERHFRYQVDNPAANQPSAVPLPASVWLFLMGALGLFGARVTGISGAGSKTEERRHAPMMQAAAA